MARKCVKDKLLSTIDDMELISKDLFESLLTPKPFKNQMGHNVDISQFADLLILKDKEVKANVKDALEQEQFERKLDLLKQEVAKQEEEIKQVQKNLKEAERILATAIYQAKQKLQFIRKANENPMPSEELIKYAHKISSSHAVAAPYNWEQGDPRRPYPIDLEMRQGLLCQQSGFPLNLPEQHQQQQFASAGDAQSYGDKPTGSGSQFLWQQAASSSTPDIKPSISLQQMGHSMGLMELKSNGNKDNLEDVEVMSTDSSSSSSSDSQ